MKNLKNKFKLKKIVKNHFKSKRKKQQDQWVQLLVVLEIKRLSPIKTDLIRQLSAIMRSILKRSNI